MDRATLGVVDQQMYMIVFAVELYSLGIKIFADACENQLHGIEMFFLEYIAPILCYEYQMNMKGKYTMPCVAQIAIYLAWTGHNFSHMVLLDQ